MMILFVLTLCLTSQLGLAETAVKDASAPVAALPMTTAEPLVAPKPSGSGGGISCYVCNSHNDTSCMDEKNLRKEHLQKCEENSVGCWRLQQWVEYDQNSDLRAHDRIIRKCAYHKQDHQCIRKSGSIGGAMVSHCFCNSTACNGSINLSQNNVFVVLLSSIFCLIIMKLFQ